MHITICICTFCRPKLLKRLLLNLADQNTNDLFTYSIVVVDNDKHESAKKIVYEFVNSNQIDITYCIEPRKSIAYARNKSLEVSKGDAIAFIDDDEFPSHDWLAHLKKTMDTYQVSGVFGPVRPHFEQNPPKWILRGQFYKRPEHQTGYILPTNECRTGNALIDKKILDKLNIIFRPQFKDSSEDTDLFYRLKKMGHSFVWCNEAIVYETIQPNRWKRRFMIKRALLRGKTSLLYSEKTYYGIFKSIIAVSIYSFSLPFLQIIGHHLFIKYLIKLCDHLGKLLALIGLNPIREREM